ncbi:MAG: L,D-transpeptidase [Lachnospiraceae bacterium]|nr:L,D-transpeptidase [Lachnospiraceae bacterium]
MKTVKRFFAIIMAVMFVSMGFMAQNVNAADLRPNFIIYVNRAANCVTVKLLGADGTETPVKAMTCSTGRAGHETPTGFFRTSAYYDWRLMVDGTYGRYAVRFNNKILFHSVPYLAKNPGTLEWDQYNLLGNAASLGCVRLSVADAKWIYDNCKKGTSVVVYDDPVNVGELGKPESIMIDPASANRGWDPTDINPMNPWLVEGFTANNQ